MKNNVMTFSKKLITYYLIFFKISLRALNKCLNLTTSVSRLMFETSEPILIN